MMTSLKPAVGTGFARLIGGAVLASLCLGAPLPAPAQAQQAPAFTDQQKAAIRDIVKEYLVQNPELIQEAMNELERRQTEAEKTARAKAISELSERLADPARAVVIGNPQGDVTLVEFFDYNCTYCKKSLSDLSALMQADPKLRVILRDFPVLGPDSVEASMVAVALKQQLKADKYLDFHIRLLESKGPVGRERALAVAKELGADMARLQKDIDQPETHAIIEETMRFGDALRLQGTPAFVVGREVIFGAVGEEPLRVAISETRKCGKAAC
jgi:protein-disulfide isomerase